MASRIEELLSLATAPLHTYLQDPQLTEIMCNDNGTCFVARVGQGVFEVEHPGMQALDVFLSGVADSVGKEWRAAAPVLSAAPSGVGWRIEAGRPPAAPGLYMSLRKHPGHVFPLSDFVGKGILTPRECTILQQAMDEKRRIIVAGGVGSAKTSLVNALLDYIRATEDRVIIAEDDPEIICTVRNCTRLYTVKGQRTLREAVQSTLRLNPTRVIIGEVRGGEALDMLKAFQTGHSGMATVHVDEVAHTMSRLEQLVQEVSVSPQRELIGEVIDLIVHMAKHPPLWRCTGIMAVRGYAHGAYITEPLE